VASVAHLAVTHLGLDVHQDTISVAILAPDGDGPDLERITHDEARSAGSLAASSAAAAASLLGGRPDRLRAGPAAAQHARALGGDRALADPKAPGDKARDRRRDGGRLARLHRPGSWSPSPSRPSKKKRSGTCAGPGPTWSPTSAGCWRNVSRSRPWPRLRPTTGRCLLPATQHWRRSRPTWPAGMTGRRSPTPFIDGAPTEASPSSGR
jgi:hypothetical protein